MSDYRQKQFLAWASDDFFEAFQQDRNQAVESAAKRVWQLDVQDRKVLAIVFGSATGKAQRRASLTNPVSLLSLQLAALIGVGLQAYLAVWWAFVPLLLSLLVVAVSRFFYGKHAEAFSALERVLDESLSAR